MSFPLLHSRRKRFQFDQATIFLCHFDGIDGATAANDVALSGNAPHAIAFNGAAQLDTDDKVFGSAALLLDGINSYITIAKATDTILGNKNFTIEGWFKRASNTTYDYMISQYTGAFNGMYLIANTTDGDNGFVTFSTGNGGGAWTVSLISTTQFLADAAWHHIAVTRNSNVWRLFLDGVKEDEDTVDITLTEKDTDIIVGIAAWNLTSNPYHGAMDEIRFSQVAKYVANFTPTGPFNP